MQHGREMKEFVVVPDALFDDVDALAPWFEKSHAWIDTLKLRPTKRKK